MGTFCRETPVLRQEAMHVARHQVYVPCDSQNKQTLRHQIKELNYSIRVFRADVLYSKKACCLQRILLTVNKSFLLQYQSHSPAGLRDSASHKGIAGETGEASWCRSGERQAATKLLLSDSSCRKDMSEYLTYFVDRQKLLFSLNYYRAQIYKPHHI